MITEANTTTIEQVRSLKEENAAEYGFSLEAIIVSARERQEASGRRIIRQVEGTGSDPSDRAESLDSQARE